MKNKKCKIHIEITWIMKDRMDAAMLGGNKTSYSEIARAGIDKELTKEGF